MKVRSKKVGLPPMVSMVRRFASLVLVLFFVASCSRNQSRDVSLATDSRFLILYGQQSDPSFDKLNVNDVFGGTAPNIMVYSKTPVGLIHAYNAKGNFLYTINGGGNIAFTNADKITLDARLTAPVRLVILKRLAPTTVQLMLKSTIPAGNNKYLLAVAENSTTLNKLEK